MDLETPLRSLLSPLGLDLYDLELSAGTLTSPSTRSGRRSGGAHQGQSRDLGVAGRQRSHSRALHTGRLESRTRAAPTDPGTFSQHHR